MTTDVYSVIIMHIKLIYIQKDRKMLDESLKQKLWEAENEISSWAEQISECIFMHPELGDQEFFSSHYLTEQIEKAGFSVTYPYLGIPTAFRCELGDEDGPTVGFLAEYDALPGYGPGHDEPAHACGHNWIAASTFAACAALAKIKPMFKGKIVYIGTPAEETAGRKVNMAEMGAFDGMAAAFQMHLNDVTEVDTVALAMTDFIFEFKGAAAHAASNPQNGINALEACNLTMAGINALRQHLEPDVRIHYSVTNGGMAPNVVPEYASMAVFVRAGQKDYLEEVIEKVLNCGRGAALMTGAGFSFKRAENTYFDIKQNHKLNSLMKEQLNGLGITEISQGDRYHSGSSDIGNVSYVCPTCYCHIGVSHLTKASAHEEDFLRIVDSEGARELLHIAAKAMAGTALEVLLGADIVEESIA